MRKILTMIVVTGVLAMVLGAGRQTAQLEVDLQAAIRMETVEGNLKGAVEAYKKLVEAADRTIAAKALIRLGGCYEKLGDEDIREARKAYERVVREYGDQTAAATEARAKLAALSTAGSTPGGSALTVRRVFQGDVQGQVSPDGRFLSFTDWASGGNLAIYDLATGQSRRLTSDGSLTDSGGFAEYSAPSPDGRTVAYAWFGPTYDLRIVGLDGSKPRVLRTSGDGVVRQYPLAWSPDGGDLLAEVINADGTRDIMLVAVGDGSAKLLKGMGRNESPGGIFSPDGRYVAWATKEGISLFELGTGQESLLLPDQTNHSVLGWAPDGKHILFASERAGSADAWLIGVSDGKAQGDPVFVMKGWGFRSMGFTRAGAFYYAVNNNVGDVQIAEIDPASGQVVSPPKSASRFGNTRSPDWSRDGRFLAFINSRDLPGRAVIIHSMESGEEREIQAGEWTVGAGFGGLRWAPDGKAIMVPASAPGKGENLVRIDVQTGKVTPLMPLPGRGGFQRYEPSPDGHAIFYVDMNEGRLVARDLRSGEETEVFKNPGLYCGVLSPDGRQLIIGLGEGQSQVLSVMPAAGGELRELIRLGGEEGPPYWGSPWWTPDGRHVAFLKGAKGKELRWELWRVAVEGGEPQRQGLTLVGQIIAGPRPHPDGRRLAISAYKANLEVWVMENFLPPAKDAD